MLYNLTKKGVLQSKQEACEWFSEDDEEIIDLYKIFDSNSELTGAINIFPYPSTKKGVCFTEGQSERASYGSSVFGEGGLDFIWVEALKWYRIGKFPIHSKDLYLLEGLSPIKFFNALKNTFFVKFKVVKDVNSGRFYLLERVHEPTIGVISTTRSTETGDVIVKRVDYTSIAGIQIMYNRLFDIA